MANIREAFEYAAQNPNSDFAKNLEKLASSGALDVDAKKNGIDLSPFKPQVEQGVASKVVGAVKDVGIGAAKGFAGSLQTVASPITNMLPAMKDASTGQELQKGFSEQELTPTNTAQKIGKGIEQVAEFVAPGGVGLKVAKVPGLLNLGARVGAEATSAGAVTLAQTGSIDEAQKGGVVGAAFPVAGKIAGTIKSEKNAGRIINSLIKTKLNDLSFGKNPGKVVAEEGITANSLEELVDKINVRKNEVGEEIGAIVSKATQDGKKLNVFEAFKPLDEAIAKAKKAELSNAPLIKKLEDLKVDLTRGKKLDDITPSDAFAIKQNVAELTKFTGNPSDDKAANAALMSVYGNIREAINKSVGDKNLPVLNDKYGNLLTAVKAGTKREDALQGQNLVSLGGKTVGGGAAIVASLLSGGAAIPTVLAGFGAVGVDKLIATPAVRTRVAKWLASRTEKERKEIFKKAPYLKGLIITNTVED